jgi:hypothetical protein
MVNFILQLILVHPNNHQKHKLNGLNRNSPHLEGWRNSGRIFDGVVIQTVNSAPQVNSEWSILYSTTKQWKNMKKSAITALIKPNIKISSSKKFTSAANSQFTFNHSL